MSRVLVRMRRQYHSTSVEDAFIQVIHELEAVAWNLDPEPILFLTDGYGRKAGDRAEYSMWQYMSHPEATFDPREGYSRDETIYVEWVNNVENERVRGL